MREEAGAAFGGCRERGSVYGVCYLVVYLIVRLHICSILQPGDLRLGVSTHCTC